MGLSRLIDTSRGRIGTPREDLVDAAPLTIAHVTGYYMPGYGYQENHLPFCQAAFGHSVHIVTSDRPVPDSRFGARDGKAASYAPDRSQHGAVTVHRLPVWFELRRRNNPCLRGFGRTLDAIAPDVVHLHGVTPLTTLAALLAPARSERIIVVDHHLCRFNLQPWTPLKRTWYWLWRRIVLPRLQSRVTAWLPINGDARGVLADTLGIRGEQVRINRLGADLEQFRWDDALRESWRRKLGIENTARVFVHAGRLGPRKEIELLIRAFALAGSERDALIIAGHGEPVYEERLRALATTARGIVRFLPMQPAEGMAGLFNAADLAVWPGDASVTLIQAMGCGLPPIIADDPGADYVDHCPDATVFRRGDVIALAQQIGTPHDISVGRRRRIVAFARQHFEWRAIAAQSIAIYRSASAAARPKTSAPSP